MDKMGMVRRAVDDALAHQCDMEPQGGALQHLYGVASLCVLLGKRRGLDSDVCGAAGLLHDVYAYMVGSYANHAASGAEMVRVVLKRLDCFTQAEQQTICAAIAWHDDIGLVHGPYDETLKDADVLYPYLMGGAAGTSARVLPRLTRLAEELGFVGMPYKRATAGKVEAMADLAQALASLRIEGSRSDARFMAMLRYWPEREAFDELRNAWCAAFVYHVCNESGIALPIRMPEGSGRFAGVGAWLEWGMQNGCYHKEDPAFQPMRGDIIIYDNLLPADRKAGGDAWHDHIGVVLAADADTLSVAEGNADGLNVSGIMARMRGEHIGGYIRIPTDV